MFEKQHSLLCSIMFATGFDACLQFLYEAQHGLINRLLRQLIPDDVLRLVDVFGVDWHC